MANDDPKHIVAVSAYITNERKEVLLVRTHWRADTWESPGGQVEPGEPLDEAVRREVLEETGLAIEPQGITGVYYNVSSHILSVVFRASVTGGVLRREPDEIKEAKFIRLTEENISEHITRPNMRSRTLDAMRAENVIPYESWETRPHQLIGRLGG